MNSRPKKKDESSLEYQLDKLIASHKEEVKRYEIAEQTASLIEQRLRAITQDDQILQDVRIVVLTTIAEKCTAMGKVFGFEQTLEMVKKHNAANSG